MITQEDVIYFVVTDRFFGKNKRMADPADRTIHGGTLDGIIQKLDYLSHLGVTAIWITPVYRNIASHGDTEPYHYYWSEDFTGIDPRLFDGTILTRPRGVPVFNAQGMPTADPIEMKVLSQFVIKCKENGIKVVLDMVVNHAGYGAQGKFQPGWFQNGQGDIEAPLAGLPDFDHDNPEVIDYFIKNIDDWIRQGGIQAIRMDTVKHVEKKFWHYFKSQIRGKHPNVFMVGEVLLQGKEDIVKLQEYQNYHDFDSVFDFPLSTALRSTLIYDESMRQWLACSRLGPDEEKGVLDYDNPLKNGYRNPNQLITLLDNHDIERRIMSEARTKHAGDAGRDYACRVTRLCLGALFTMRGIPQLYYGTEVGLEGWKQGGSDCDMRRDFPWYLIDPATGEPRAECTRERELFTYTRQLIELRKSNSALKYGTTITLWADDLVYAYLRISLDRVCFCIINNG